MSSPYDTRDTHDGSEMHTGFPMWLWGLAGLALLWNLMGLAAFGVQVALPPEKLGETAEQVELYKTFPVWALVAFGAATICGTLGSLALLLKSRFATILFVISLVGIVIQQYYMFLVSDMMKVMPDASIGFPITVLCIGCLLLGLSIQASKRGWLK